MKKLKISLVTGTRAEYGLLRNIIRLLSEDIEVDFSLIVTGTHLSKEYGHTIDEIIEDGFVVSAEIPCIQERNDDVGMVLSTAVAMQGFAKHFESNRPDMIILLGDRYEIFACAVAAAMMRIPIAHLYGGDTTEGAIDEFFRHSITKMSYLHFVSNEDSKRRVIQLGEDPRRVFNFGATGAENIMGMKLLDKDALGKALGIDLSRDYALVTYHPVTLSEASVEEQIKGLFSAIDKHAELDYIFTKANADSNGMVINRMIDDYATERKNVYVFESLGILKYLSAMKYAKMVVGNSSSGIYEAPLFGIPTVNIGERQRGRLQSQSVINCNADWNSIYRAITEALKSGEAEVVESPYFKENTSENIVNKVKETIRIGKIDLEKGFWIIDEKCSFN